MIAIPTLIIFIFMQRSKTCSYEMSHENSSYQPKSKIHELQNLK